MNVHASEFRWLLQDDMNQKQRNSVLQFTLASGLQRQQHYAIYKYIIDALHVQRQSSLFRFLYNILMNDVLLMGRSSTE